MNLETAPKCKAPGCEIHTKSAVGYCAKHYFLSRAKNQGEVPMCSVCGDTLRRDNATGLCKKHRSSSPRTQAPIKPKKVQPSAIRGGQALKDPGSPLAQLKAELLAKIAAIEVVEKLLAG